MAVLADDSPFRQQITSQCTAVKQELYRIKTIAAQMSHKDNRETLERLMQTAFDDVDKIQEFISSR